MPIDMRAARRDFAQFWTCAQFGAMFMANIMLWGFFAPYISVRLGLLPLALFVVQAFVRTVSVFHPKEYNGRTLSSLVVDAALSIAIYIVWTRVVRPSVEIPHGNEDFVERWTRALRTAVSIGVTPDFASFYVAKTMVFPVIEFVANRAAPAAYARVIDLLVYDPNKEPEKEPDKKDEKELEKEPEKKDESEETKKDS